MPGWHRASEAYTAYTELLAVSAAPPNRTHPYSASRGLDVAPLATLKAPHPIHSTSAAAESYSRDERAVKMASWRRAPFSR
jgi:hypothetical protein